MCTLPQVAVAMNNYPQSYEHLDVLWGRNVDKDVIPKVIETLIRHCDSPETVSNHVRRLAHRQEEEITTTISSSD